MKSLYYKAILSLPLLALTSPAIAQDRSGNLEERVAKLEAMNARLIAMLEANQSSETGYNSAQFEADGPARLPYSAAAPPPPPPHCKENSVMWSLPQAMPYPAVCAGLAQQDRFNCRNELLKTIIYDNLRWPNLDDCVEGTAVVTFTVTDTGELQGFKIVRDPGAGTGKEALRVVKLMAEQTAPWIPGTQGLKKKPVPVQFNMPVKFKLE